MSAPSTAELPPSRCNLRVRYEETDQMGVVYHANYLRYFEVGRTELLRHRGLSYRELEERGALLAVIDLGARYRSAARYDDVLEIETRIAELRRTRVRFEYRILRQDELLVEGWTVLACLGSDLRPRRFPAELLAVLDAQRPT